MQIAMGGALTKCVTKSENSKDKENWETAGYVKRRRFKQEEHAVTSFSSHCEATEYINPNTDETAIRVQHSEASIVSHISQSSSFDESKNCHHSRIIRSRSAVTEWDIIFKVEREKQQTKDSSRPKSAPNASSLIYVNQSRDASQFLFKNEYVTNVDVKVEEQPVQKSEMTDTSTTESELYEGQFKALTQTDFVPRYQYHRFLLNWFSTGLQTIQDFPVLKFRECSIIVGGEINDENLSFLIGKNTGSSEMSLTDVEQDSLVGAEILVVYFVNNKTENICHNLMDFAGNFSFNEGTVLLVIQRDDIVEESLKSTFIESVSMARMNVDFVAKHRSEVITRITCILEKRLLKILMEAQRYLCEVPLTENVDTSLLEVRAILRRLKQAASFPNLLSEMYEEFQKGRMDDMLQSFGDRILWHGFDGDTLHIITTDMSVQEVIENTLSKPEFEHMKYSITVQDELSVKLLTKPGEPLHGAKFVYVNNGRDAFLRDEKFATTGSLMLANDSLMVVVTSRHAFSNQENIFVLVERSVLRLGQTVITSQHTKERLCEDITLVKLDSEAVSIVNEQCEKLLIDATGVPTPGRISPRELRVGDIVHKRGARTGLTTGIVKSILFSKLGGYPKASPIIQICGRGLQPFAGEGDSGSLIFQHSLSPDENSLDVLAMVQSKLNVPIPTAPIVCFPLKEGCETLHRSVSGLQSLQFFNV